MERRLRSSSGLGKLSVCFLVRHGMYLWGALGFCGYPVDLQVWRVHWAWGFQSVLAVGVLDRSRFMFHAPVVGALGMITMRACRKSLARVI